jgi:hypothetical protein
MKFILWTLVWWSMFYFETLVLGPFLYKTYHVDRTDWGLMLGSIINFFLYIFLYIKFIQ